MLRTPVNVTRLRILAWLREAGGDRSGFTADDVAAGLGVSRPVVLAHLRLLTALGMLRTDCCADPVVYRCDEARIAEVAEMFEKGW
ncbi:winged helix-turn-helix domain-containing protein [Streptomyces capillispiralis]|uniref:ArsR family transcriptional regulator n=1 Tax=Streptomyces capillispiralis TaxID=68182 RepID=A0A561TQL4_9ACTN|nr:winged helix-turn-helix domain-containing protein [Streptomyces capillispiralis]TWF89399.1 ArsR family transcriptional regulator [Streptomyces capillispiralis]